MNDNKTYKTQKMYSELNIVYSDIIYSVVNILTFVTSLHHTNRFA